MMICSTKLQYIAWQGHNINQQNQPTNHLSRRGQVAWFNRRTMGCRLWEVLIWVVNAWLSHALALSIHPIAKVRPFFSFPKAVRAFTPTINVACEWALFWTFVSHLGPISAPTPVSHVHTFLHICIHILLHLCSVPVLQEIWWGDWVPFSTFCIQPGYGTPLDQFVFMGNSSHKLWERWQWC
jgi:hypothetical protein